MRAAVLHAPNDIRVESVADPEPLSGHAIVRVDACGVCGSDIPRMLTKGAYRLPLICGHEFSGRIVSVGSGLEGFQAGQLVTVPPLIPCYKCDQCLKGAFSRCRDYDYFGSRRDGAYAEYVSVPRSNLVAVPHGVPPEAASMTDPAAIALHAVWRCRPHVGMHAAVVGCGPIGLFAIQWLRIAGAHKILAVDIADAKLAMAEEAGATEGCRPDGLADHYGRYDLVVEAAGHPSPENDAIRLTGPGGETVLVGIPDGAVPLDAKTFDHVLRQEATLHGSWNSFSAPFPGAEWTTTLEAFASGELKWKYMITHDLTLPELPAMFDAYRAGTEMAAKVLFRP